MNTTDDTSAADRGSALSEGLGAWLPIATAPDGVMLIFADMKAVEARWWAFCGWRHNGLKGDSVQMPDNTARTATHWQHLPTPPRSA